MSEDVPATGLLYRLHRIVGAAGYSAIWAGLVAGTVLYLFDQPAFSKAVLGATFGVLIVLPIANVLIALCEEARRRDWIFVGLASAVLGLVAFAVVRQLP
jgi:hypothetical protein